MKRKMLLVVLWSLSQSLSAADIILDDFSKGHIYQMSVKCGTEDKTVRAEVPGKHRWVRLQVNKPPECKEGNPFAQSVSANVQSGLPLIVNNGYNVHSRTEIHYGRTNEDQKHPMNLDLTAGTGSPFYLEAVFTGAASGLNLNVGIFAKNGPKRASCGVNVPPNKKGFSVVFPLDKFRMENEMQLIDYQDTDFVSFIVQTTDGNFGISQLKFTAQPAVSAIKADC
ncbi:MAG: hypothetical protein ACPGVP_12265 [Thiolinea sp.]